MTSSSLSNMIDPSLLSSLPEAVPDLFYQPSPPVSRAISVVSSLAPSDSASAVPSRSNSLRRSRSHRSRDTVHASPEWSNTHQQRFEERLIRLMASAGFPLAWIENPEWLDLCCDFIPAAKNPSWKTLTRRILPKTLLALRTAVKQTIRGQNVTVQCDGWSGENNHHYIAFMVTSKDKVILRTSFWAVTDRFPTIGVYCSRARCLQRAQNS